MNYSVSNEVPEGWNHIIKTFLEVVEYDVRVNNGVPIDDVQFSTRHNVLTIGYFGGDRLTDSYAFFSQVLSGNTCTECGLPATRKVFESPKCDDCF